MSILAFSILFLQWSVDQASLFSIILKNPSWLNQKGAKHGAKDQRLKLSPLYEGGVVDLLGVFIPKGQVIDHVELLVLQADIDLRATF